MRPLYTFTVKPSLPRELEPLQKLAGNLKWCWDHELMAIFRRIDGDLWEETGHNPLMMLGLIKQERFEELAEDDSFVSQLKRATQRLSYLRVGHSVQIMQEDHHPVVVAQLIYELAHARTNLAPIDHLA